MTFIVIFVLSGASIALAALWQKRFGGYMPEAYRTRLCQGFAWKRVFPSSPHDEIRIFLRLFAQAFAYRDAQMLQVSPADRVIDVYRAEHPQTGGIDGLEMEALAAKIEKTYKIDFNAVWSEALTFGALFAACLAAGSAKGRQAEA